jgi:hypothetical protein
MKSKEASPAGLGVGVNLMMLLWINIHFCGLMILTKSGIDITQVHLFGSHDNRGIDKLFHSLVIIFGQSGFRIQFNVIYDRIYLYAIG